MRILLASILLLATLACGKAADKQPPAGQPAAGHSAAGQPAAGRYDSTGIKKNLAEIRAAMASPDPSSAKYKCALLANVDEIAKHDAASADELRQLCTKDLYLAVIKLEVDKAEAARKAKPSPAVIDECYNSKYEYARKEMKKASTLELAKDLIARFDAVCPKT